MSVKSHESGAVLLLTLLFLFVITLLVSNSIENSLLETKMSANGYYKAMAWEVAETGLRIAEARISGKVIEGSVGAQYHIKLLKTDTCGRARYQITSRGCYQGVQRVLVSEYDELNRASSVACKREIASRRVLWEEP